MTSDPECGVSWLLDGRWWIGVGLVLALIAYAISRQLN